jgi:hypothetical protein
MGAGNFIGPSPQADLGNAQMLRLRSLEPASWILMGTPRQFRRLSRHPMRCARPQKGPTAYVQRSDRYIGVGLGWKWWKADVVQFGNIQSLTWRTADLQPNHTGNIMLDILAHDWFRISIKKSGVGVGASEVAGAAEMSFWTPAIAHRSGSWRIAPAGKLLLLPPHDTPINVTGHLLAMLLHKKWITYFFSQDLAWHLGSGYVQPLLVDY